ncbi:AMIN domain-containing protein [Sulfurospirillum sp. 1612]|uniref:AMIN domain-containing protein n=1 Tax=Sulfurospirillum sp. 1612 TaxID=3094835 RepID=UPI002F94849A
MRKLAFILCLSLACVARDNPFQAVENIDQATHQKSTNESFKEATMTLPDSARIMKSVAISYQNLDGSIATKTVTVDKSIDWHDTFKLGIAGNISSYHEVAAPPDAAPEHNMTKIDKPAPIVAHSQHYKFKDFIQFKIMGKALIVMTKDKLIRNFLVSKPYKVVLDFRRDARFLTKTFKTDTTPFVSIVLGNHDRYYRVAITLDGQYGYTLNKEQKGEYRITLK